MGTATLVVAAMISGAATAADLTEEQRTIVQVFEAPGADKADVFRAGRQWIAENFRSAKAVIEYESAADGTIIGKGFIPYPCASGWECVAKPDWTVPFTLRFEAKDQRFRLTFSDLRIQWPAKYANGVTQPAGDLVVRKQKDLDKIKAKLIETGPGIQAMVGKAKPNDDW
ncbi:DUF4468 domain-containing protein [Stenotrophomonas sp. SMYL20]|uniref:DUF4468 domain-containing protein n=1 Tax=Stenotrophomonas sp. SMYL20 TaxID=3076043 RepID=UPI002E772D88|nr:DUF4468 domain-containing protein [Stenotrophomonas sp. SMYL20]